MDSHKVEPMSPQERAWTEYLRWTQGAVTGDYVEIERKAWARLQLALMPKDVNGREAGDALDALAALDGESDQK
jgi:hypothetical protein